MAEYLQSGRVVGGRYRIEQLVGEGGMAAVYRVRHAQLDTMHALKVLTISSKSVQRRLMQEGRVQAAINHPNICLLYTSPSPRDATLSRMPSSA